MKKLFHIMFAGAAALLGGTAANTYSANDVVSEAFEENPGSHVEEPGFCPLIWVQLMHNPSQWMLEEVQNEQSAFCYVDAPSASVVVSTAADDDTATDDDDDTDGTIDLPRACSTAQLVCPFVYVQHVYNPMQWEIAVVQNEQSASCYVDAPSASVAASTATADDTDGAIDLPRAYVAAQPVCPFVYVQHVYNPMQREVANVDVCSVDGAKDDDNIDQTDGDVTIIPTDGDVTDPVDASTGGGEEALHDNGQTTEASDEIIGDNGPTISTEGVGSMPANSSVAENDVAPVGLESVLRLKLPARKDPSFRVVLSQGSDVEPPTLTLFELGTDKTTGLTPTKVVQLTADVQVRAMSRVAFKVLKGKEFWIFNARDREERDRWTDALVHAIDEAATPDDGDMASGKGSATSLSGNLSQKTGLGMQPWKLTLTGSVLTACKRGTRACKVVQLTADVQVQAVSLVAFKVFKGKESWVFDGRDREERDIWTDALLHAIDEAATPDDGDMASGKGSATSMSDVIELKMRTSMQPRKVTLTGPVLTTCKLAKTGRVTKACEDLRLDALSDAVHVNDEKGGKGPTRFLFRVTEHSFPPAQSRTFDAGSADERVKWVAAIKAAADGTKTKGEEGDAEEEAKASPTPSFTYPPSRGQVLGPEDEPLFPGEHMSNLDEEKPTTLEVTQLGDVLLSPGRFPDRAQEPLWAHRMTGTFGGRAIGGLGCALEDFLQRLSSRAAIPVTLSVKNGRWRVGRGALCTLGRSPAPKGSLRRFLPWDVRGQEIREGSLVLLDDDSVVIVAGQTLLWDSLTAA